MVATWELLHLVENFLDICIDLHLEGHKLGSHLNATGYEKLEKRLFVLHGVQQTRSQLKNKFERLCTDWQLWKTISLQTEIGWNQNTQTWVGADDHWWEQMTIGGSNSRL